MKKFRQLIREVGEETAMYNHLHMNLLKASLVRSPANGPRPVGRPRTRKPAEAKAGSSTHPPAASQGRPTTVRHLQTKKDANTQVSDLLLKCYSQGRGTDLCLTLAMELIDCLYTDLTYRYLPVGRDMYLEISPKEAVMLPSNWGCKRRLFPCKPARILISATGVLEFQVAYKVMLSTKLPQRDGLALRKIYSEHFERLQNKSGAYAFCVGFSTSTGDVPSSYMCPEVDNVQPCTLGLGCRAKTCDLWFQPGLLKPESQPKPSVKEEPSGNQPLDLSLGHFAPDIAHGLAVCGKCQETERILLRKRRRKQCHPRKVAKVEHGHVSVTDERFKGHQQMQPPKHF